MAVTILLYHAVDDSGSILSVPPAAFRVQMRAVRACGRPVMTASELARRIAAGNPPSDAVCITFDDGYRSVAREAWPVLREFGLPATVFLTHDAMGREPFWMRDRFAALFDADQAQAEAAIDRFMPRRAVRSPALRRDRLGAFRRAASLPIMDWPEARALADAGLDFGAHTLTHPVLPTLSEAAQRREIGLGRQRVEAAMGRPMTCFAYPYGDHDAVSVRAVAEAGFDLAVTTAPGSARRPAEMRYLLPRDGIWPHEGYLRLRLRLSGAMRAAESLRGLARRRRTA